MLQQLEISHYAIIEHVSIDFDEQLNILTGETGAGKSIIIGALSLLLGERIDWTYFEQQEKKCVLEARFQIKFNPAFHTFFEKHEMPITNTQIILRREINPSTKTSRNFINDNLATSNQLKELGTLLVDLHQQFDTLELYDTAFQFQMLDALANQIPLLTNYQQAFKQYNTQKDHLQQLLVQQQQAHKDVAYYTFLLQEFEEFGLKDNELETIETELKTLTNAADIQQALSKTTFVLLEEGSCVSQLQQLVHQLKSFHDLSAIQEISSRISAAAIELDDVAKDAQRMIDKFNADPERLALLSERLSTGYKLLKKHQAKSTQDLLNTYEQIKTAHQNIQNIDEQITLQKKLVQDLESTISQQAKILDENRRKIVPVFIEQIEQLLQKIGMANAQLKIDLTASDLNVFGCNNIDFLLDANRSNSFKSIKKVASGGELNRLMLAIKSVIANSLALPTLIFDEIDTGVSGEVAKQIGEILSALSSQLQIICITHQASIAAKGKKHFYIYKDKAVRFVSSHIKTLNTEERITHIAEILSGTPPTNAAIVIAKEMLA